MINTENIEPKITNNWDYKGLSKHNHFFGEQNDWNQTLITKINELSAHIHMSSCTIENPNGLGPADTIMMNKRCFELVKKFEHFKPEEMKLGSRLDVVVNEMIGADAVFVFIKDIPENHKNKDRTIGVVKILNY